MAPCAQRPIAASGEDGSQRDREPEAHEVRPLDERAAADGDHVGRAAAGEHADVGVRADDCDGADARAAGAGRPSFLRSTVPCSATAWATARFAAASTVPGDGGVVVETHGEDRADDPVDHVVEPGLGHLPRPRARPSCRRTALEPGISMSSPAMAAGPQLWVPNQSDMTKPWKAQSRFSTPLSSESFSEHQAPSTRL